MVLAWNISWLHSQEVGWACSHPEGWTGAGGTISKMTHRAVDGSPPFFSLWSIESPHSMVADFLQRQCTEGAAVSFVFLILEVTHYHCCLTLILLEASHWVQLHIQREETYLHLLKETVPGKWWNMLKTPYEVFSQPWVCPRGWSSTSRPSLGISLLASCGSKWNLTLSFKRLPPSFLSFQAPWKVTDC